MAAVKAALAEGVVPGGGATLVNLATSYTHVVVPMHRCPLVRICPFTRSSNRSASC